MHDIAIRGGTIVDGTGSPRYTGDVAVDDGQITAVGGKAGPARREIDADGLVVAPGWVDIHTHYDGQAMWDPLITPSSLHGVTTVMFGNCGVGFAPCRPSDHRALIELMEGVEDIPGIVLDEGLPWDWQSYPEFLDALERRPRAIDIGAQVPHHALRVFVMGERALRREPAKPDDIAQMRALTLEGLRAGAFGFTTSRTQFHRTVKGAHVPGYFAEVDELLGIGSALGEIGRGAFGMLNDFANGADDFIWIRKQARDTGRPVWFMMSDLLSDPGRWPRLMNEVRASIAEGLTVAVQVPNRAIGMVVGLWTSTNPFSGKRSFVETLKLSHDDQLARLKNPDVRQRILEESDDPALVAAMPPIMRPILTEWSGLYLLGDPLDYDSTPSRSMKAQGERAGKTPAEFAYDHLTGGDGSNMLFFPLSRGNSRVREMLLEQGTIPGGSDGGAHCGCICDASMPTFALTHWAKSTAQGEPLPLEWLVRRQTSGTAWFYGLADRGRLAPGLRADINLIDFERMTLHPPHVVYDLPAGGRRLIQRADGYVMTIVKGETTFENGVHTGALPGRLLRSGKSN